MFSLFFIFLNSLALSQNSIPFDADLDSAFVTWQKEKVKNIEEAILLLEDNFFKSNQYALVFKSGSIQPGTTQNPRILLFGKNHLFRMGFNHRQGKERNLEILQWRKKQKKWELRELSFTPSGPELSKANPSTCLTCHQDRIIHPNFDFEVDRLHPQKSQEPNVFSFLNLNIHDKIFRRFEKPGPQKPN